MRNIFPLLCAGLGLLTGLQTWAAGELEPAEKPSVIASVRWPLGTAPTLSQYTPRAWQIQDGLPHNSVQAICQTRNGFLWLGTPKGLVRFDGIHFTDFDVPEIKGRSVTSLCEAKDGSLWIGTEGEGLVRWKEQSLRRYSQASGLAGDSIRAIFEHGDGSIWIGTTEGLTQFRHGKFNNFTRKDGLTHNTVRAICAGDDGALWLGTDDGLNYFKDGKIAASFSIESGLPHKLVRAVCRDRNGNLWIGTDGGLIRHRGRRSDEGEFGDLYLKKDGLADNVISLIYEDRKNNLWIGTYGGLCRLVGEKYQGIDVVVQGTFLTELNFEGAAYDRINTAIEDQEGNLWVGSKDGVSRLKRRIFQTYGKQDGLAHNNVVSVLEGREKTLWIATWGGGLNQLRDGKVLSYSDDNHLVTSVILSICEGRDGNLWFGADYDGGLYQLRGANLTRFYVEDGLVNTAVRVIYEDRQTNLWIGTSKTLTLFKNGKFTNYTTEDGLAGNTVRVILQVDDGSLWIGTNDGLSRWREGKFTNFTTRDGLSHNTVIALHQDPENNLWIGTGGGGLCRMRRQETGVRSQESGSANQKSKIKNQESIFTSYSTKQGLLSDDIFEILEDDDGYLWMSCLNGVFRVSKKSLDEFDEGQLAMIPCASYGKADGMASVQCNGVSKPAGWKAQDGRLWFPTTKGVVVADPRLKVDQAPPPVVIEEIIADKQYVANGEWRVARTAADHVTRHVSPVTIGPGRGELEIRYTALSFSAPEKNRFKYKLEGIDPAWVDAGTRRSAYYNNLRPGHYEFRVLGCNNDGVWNELGANVKLSLQPHFWQTKWFLILVAITGIGAVGGTVRYFTWLKLRRRVERLEHQHALEKERTRIAQDMHDDLGARLTQILMLSDFASTDARGEKEMRGHLGRIANAARDLVRNLDGIVWAVNPKHDFIDNLAMYLAEYMEMFLAGSPIRFRWDVPADLPHHSISSEARHNLFLVVKEALNNVVKHSAATEVWLRLKFDRGILAATLEDNGKGFAVAHTDVFGNGLLNMRKRIESIGGEFNLSSQPGQGTRLHLEIPLR